MEKYDLSPAECAGYNSTRKYKLMQCGMGPKQPLQLLYPGRVLLPDYNPDGSNIPHEDMEGLEKTRKMSQALRTAYDMEKEALSRHLGGKHKIYPLPAVEPDAIINDPRLSGVGLEFGGEAPTPKNSPVENPIENAREMVQTFRQENKIEETSSKPFRGYDWENDYAEVYPSIPEEDWSEGTVSPTFKDTSNTRTVENFELPKPKKLEDRKKNQNMIYGMMAICFVFLIILFIFLGFLVVF